ncbi:nucleotidyltransferase domain-containing protein [Ignisphaera sp. 4213-co]|uniref:Nucleotidyltransferase domain-containing protein n=1 Tax=Ignisphaera cupida TaxID=3050454 RepID=A0ABD4Z7K2_9CREN|nr:nucleotidyltransferase domain-containing protein [Ignisphaera sp. 4213-co]MDK6028922.1 nucleotidyltransferase domain-containing protein [Ignisphaera sp. 4213-co]
MRSQKLLEIRNQVIEALKKVAKELNATIYLFGSYARGDHMIDSDVDIVVVSDIFKGMDFPKRVELVRLKLPREISFDIIPLTPDELKKKMETAFYKEISKYWIEIKPD